MAGARRGRCPTQGNRDPAGHSLLRAVARDARAGAGEFARGAAAGTRVAIAADRALAFAQSLHACLLLGAVAVPVDLRLSETERERLRQAHP